MKHPYDGLQDNKYWRTAVGQKNFLAIHDLWSPKYPITKSDKIVTAGSCFAQHISRAMRGSGYNWVNYEVGPKYLLKDQLASLNYGIYSFRTSNIYTVRALRQWIEWALDDGRSIKERVWAQDGRFFDPYRPSIEPNGFHSEAEVIASRRTTLRAINSAVKQADLFVFTLGLTESWRSRETAETYAICPGTLCGTFDPSAHVFVNSDYIEILEDMNWIIGTLKGINPSLRMLLTVSPVPLTATATGEHVLPSTIYSKSVLRAVAGKLTQDHAHIDYFPSYEIISSFPYRGAFYEPNMRGVAREGVAHVMKQFLAALSDTDVESPDQPTGTESQVDMSSADLLVCEEQFLDEAQR